MIFLNESMVEGIIVESWIHDDFIYNMNVLDNTIAMQLQECYACSILNEGVTDILKNVFNRIIEMIRKFVQWISKSIKVMKQKIRDSKEDKYHESMNNKKKKVTIYKINFDKWDNIVDGIVSSTKDLTDLSNDFFEIYCDILSNIGSEDKEDKNGKINNLIDKLDNLNNNLNNQINVGELVEIVDEELGLDEFRKERQKSIKDLNYVVDAFTEIVSKNNTLVSSLQRIITVLLNTKDKKLDNKMIIDYANRFYSISKSNINNAQSAATELDKYINIVLNQNKIIFNW